ARTLGAPGAQVSFLVTGEQAQGASVFEFTVAPGSSPGAHVHANIEEIFYVVDGEFDLRVGDRTERAGPGALMFVPKGAAHTFTNPGPAPARLLAIVSPPGLERYFEELVAILNREGPRDPAAIATLRSKYGTEQLADLEIGG
ncbi:MAG TPA: cupin domain-containing protein, partial [Ktedonobacterales bacterium]|nr:cupin domain-containing protein [Ktedonobacterales bacterium]